MNIEEKNSNEPQALKLNKPVVRCSIYSFAVTGTFHGSIIEAESEGEARRIFHKHYNGESIIHVRQRGNLPVWAYHNSYK